MLTVDRRDDRVIRYVVDGAFLKKIIVDAALFELADHDALAIARRGRMTSCELKLEQLTEGSPSYHVDKWRATVTIVESYDQASAPDKSK